MKIKKIKIFGIGTAVLFLLVMIPLEQATQAEMVQTDAEDLLGSYAALLACIECEDGQTHETEVISGDQTYTIVYECVNRQWVPKNVKLASPPDHGNDCPGCGRYIQFDAKFCPYCGRNFESYSVDDKKGKEEITDSTGEGSKKRKFCSECGSKIEIAGKFCPHCGNKL